MSDDTSGPPTDTAGGAVGGPGRHPVDVVQTAGGETPEGAPREPDELMARLIEDLESARLEDSHGQEVLRIDGEEYLDFCTAAKATGFDMCVDVTVVDWFRHRRARFELVVNLLSFQHRRRLRVLVPLPADEPTAPSITGLWPGAGFGEREAYDMYGIEFEGHPDLTRILMPDDWEGFPLRKDFATGAVPVQFKESHQAT